LSPEQLAQYRLYRHFDVTGCHSGKRYRIRYGVSMNVCELDSLGRPLVGRCFVPKDNLVAGDVMLAQKIALEDVMAVPLWTGLDVYMTSADVKGFHLGPESIMHIHK